MKTCPECKCPCSDKQEYCICGYKFGEVKNFFDELFGSDITEWLNKYKKEK